MYDDIHTAMNPPTSRFVNEILQSELLHVILPQAALWRGSMEEVNRVWVLFQSLFHTRGSGRSFFCASATCVIVFLLAAVLSSCRGRISTVPWEFLCRVTFPRITVQITREYICYKICWNGVDISVVAASARCPFICPYTVDYIVNGAGNASEVTRES